MSQKNSLVLHIGTEKTGTTAIQEFLYLNTNRYADKGVIIPNCIGNKNHYLFTCCFYSNQRHDDLTRMLGMNNIKERIRKKGIILNRLMEQVSNATAKKFIISSEHLHSRLSQDLEVESLFNFVSSLFATVDVVVYVRNPLETALSAWSTAVKYGSTFASLPAPSEPYTRNLCMHKESILRWGKYFGESNVHIRLFRKDAFLGNNLLRDFTDACNIDFSDEMMLPPKLNEKLGYDGILFLGQINKILDSDFLLCRDLIPYFEKYFSTSPEYIPSTKEISEYSHYYNHSDQWVKEYYFPSFNSLWGDSKYSLVQPQSDQIDQESSIIQRTYSHEEVTRLLSLFAEAWKNKNGCIHSLESETARKSEEIKLHKDKIKSISNIIREIVT